MAITITTPGTGYLPGKDDNIYSFVGSNAGNANYFYTVQLKVNNNVVDKFTYHSLGANTPVKVNIKHLIRPYLELPTFVEQATIQESYGCLKVELVVSGTDGTHTDPEITSPSRYYWNGTSKDFWRGKWNSDTITSYIPTGSGLIDRAQWVGPQRPAANTVMLLNNRLSPACVSEAYHISPYAKGTVCFVPAYNGDLGEEEQNWGNKLYIHCFTPGRAQTKTLYRSLPVPRISDSTNKFATIPIGVEQINNLISTFSVIYHTLTPISMEIDPTKERYYVIEVVNSVNANICTRPLTFEICPAPAPTGVWDMSRVSIKYYSKLGAWWQLPGHCKNVRDVQITSLSKQSSVTTTGKGTYSRNRDLVHVESNDFITVYTDWIPLNALSEYEDLIQSPETWLNYGGFYIPVVLQGSTYRVDETNHRTLVQYELKFTAAYDKQTIL